MSFKVTISTITKYSIKCVSFYLTKSSDYISQRNTKTAFTGASWTVLSSIEQSIKEKIEQAGKPLKYWDVKIYRGILTGYNEAFIIDTITKEKLVAASPKSAEIIRPILRGRDIKSYKSDWAGLYIIATHTGYKSQTGEIIPPVQIDDYPAVKQHLDQFSTQLSARQDKGITPYHLRSCIYMEDFYKQKIVWGEISDRSKFAYDDMNFFIEATSFIMTGEKLKYLFACLNSKLIEWFFNQLGTATGVGTNRWKKYTIELVPLIIPSAEFEREIEKLVDEILSDGEIKTNSKLIDNKIYHAYGLSNEEVIFIENYRI